MYTAEIPPRVIEAQQRIEGYELRGLLNRYFANIPSICMWPSMNQGDRPMGLLKKHGFQIPSGEQEIGSAVFCKDVCVDVLLGYANRLLQGASPGQTDPLSRLF